MQMPRTLALALALCTADSLASSAAPLAHPALRLRVDGSNTHPAASTAATLFTLRHATPTFTWAAEHEERGAVQAAFELTVTDAATGLVAHSSGRLMSRHASYVLPAPLPGSRTYTWGVVWFDADGNVSPPSSPAAFHVGLNDPADWEGVPWLGSNTTNLYRSVAGLGDTSTLAAATLYVCALGYGKVSVNGKPVSAGLMTVSGWTNNERLNLYATYNITAHVREAAAGNGALALGVALGHGWRDQSKFPRHDPDDTNMDETDRVFRVQLRMTHTDGRVTTLHTTGAPSWTTAAGPVTADSVYDGETYDARLEAPGWDTAGFGASGWARATVVHNAPRGKMAASAMPEVTIDSVSKPVNITQPKPGVFVVDFGRNVAGWTSIKNMKGKAGTTVVMRHAEVLQHVHLPDLKGHIEPGMIYVGNLRSAKATDTYILKGEGSESYTPSFTYHGCRYVEVTGFPGTLTADDIEYHHFHTANAVKAKTKFSSKTVEAIQKLALGAQRSNMMTVPTDCDQRDERLGWMGDMDLSAHSMLLNYDCAAFATMFMENMDSEMNADGSLTDVVPNVRYGGRPADPSWSAAFIETAFQLWKIDGVTAIAKEYWPRMALHLKAYADDAAASPTHWPKTKYGDWVPAPFPPGVQKNAKKPDRPMTSAHAWMGNIQEMIELATALGEKGTAASLQATLSKLGAQYNENWLSSNGTYGNAVQSTYTLPLNLGIVPTSAKAKVEANFLQSVTDAKLHMTTGIIGGKYFYQALADMGKKDTALAVLEKTDYPGFGFMITNTLEPATENLWELMDGPYEGTGMNSRNHHMWSSVSTYLVQGLAGLDQQQHSAGYEHVKLVPSGMPGSPGASGLSAAAASLDLPRGEVSLDWAWEGGVQCATAADGSDLSLDCGAHGGNITSVKFASYGAPEGMCGAFEKGECDQPEASAVVTAACMGQRSCTFAVAPETLGSAQGRSCAAPLHAQRLHVEVECSAPASLSVRAKVPLTSDGTVYIPTAPHHKQLTLDADTDVWARGAAYAPVAGLKGITEEGSVLAVRVGSGTFSFVLK